MKLIFLDIDGVLVTTNVLTPSDKYFGRTFDKIYVQNLYEAIRGTEIKAYLESLP
ncbi:hypothetical protein LJK88_21820 [Paenibacillus sp. P26]|nr:hypothetical protein LJK88_21820 [Paenibacillus sp. P26]